MKKAAMGDAERAWQIMVSLAIETRSDWRRKVNEATGLPFNQMRALKRLKTEPRSLSELAYAMSVDAPAATVIVNDLEKRGLVERKAHPEDRRSKLVSATAEGRKLVAVMNRINDPPPQALAQLPAQDLAALRRILEAVARDD